MLLDGRKVAIELKASLKEKIAKLKIKPHLVVVLVGSDPASLTYVNSKKRQAEQVGMASSIIKLPESTSTETLLETVKKLNQDDSVHGILVQLPLPKQIDTNRVIEAIDIHKDVDGLHPLNVGLLRNDRPYFIPCTPKGVMRIFEYYDIELEGKNALVIGRSQLIGKPIASLLLKENATVTQAHSKTKNIQQLIENNDIIIVAVGHKAMIKKDMLNEHHIVIDVGIHEDGETLVGDVEKASYDKVKAITPVPGGVGPMTIASLLENTYIAYLRKEGLDETSI